MSKLSLFGAEGRTRTLVPAIIAVGMLLLVGVSVLEGGAAPASALPAPAQYTTPGNSNNTTSFWATPLGIATIGGVVAIVLIALVLLLLMRRRRGSSGSSDEEDEGEKTDDDDDGSEGDEGQGGGEDEGSSGGGSEDEEPMSSPDS